MAAIVHAFRVEAAKLAAIALRTSFQAQEIGPEQHKHHLNQRTDKEPAAGCSLCRGPV